MCAVTARLCFDLLTKLMIPHRLCTAAAVVCGGGMYFLSLYLLCDDLHASDIFLTRAKQCVRE